jgi:hypothetical protein
VHIGLCHHPPTLLAGFPSVEIYARKLKYIYEKFSDLKKRGIYPTSMFEKDIRYRAFLLTIRD